MCSINPKHSAHFTLDVYTSVNMSEEFFNTMVLEKILKAEILLNEDSRLRFHIKMPDQKRPYDWIRRRLLGGVTPKGWGKAGG